MLFNQAKIKTILKHVFMSEEGNLVMAGGKEKKII